MRYCHRAGPRILIPRSHPASEDRCSTQQFATCPVYRELYSAADAPAPPCPLLEESLMQYCSAAAITKFIPYSEALLSRCGNGSYEYCDLYLQLSSAPTYEDEEHTIPIRDNARYTANHLWIDLSGEGVCHIGIDGFLARMLGPVDSVGYLSNGGTLGRPSAVVTAHGVDYRITFPQKVMLNNCNLYLRAEPSRLTSQPYTAGWLFEATIDPLQRSRLEAATMDAAAARTWMDSECRRMNEVLQSQSSEDLRADGGLFTRGVLVALGREEALRLYDRFCTEDVNA
jgi:glycine cleavage system H lipoate-binding protein